MHSQKQSVLKKNSTLIVSHVAAFAVGMFSPDATLKLISVLGALFEKA